MVHLNFVGNLNMMVLVFADEGDFASTFASWPKVHGHLKIGEKGPKVHLFEKCNDKKLRTRTAN